MPGQQKLNAAELRKRDAEQQARPHEAIHVTAGAETHTRMNAARKIPVTTVCAGVRVQGSGEIEPEGSCAPTVYATAK